MFIFLLQIRHMLGGHPELYLFAVYSLLIWGLWLTKLLLSQRYRPTTASFDVTTSVVIPVVDEPLDLFRDVLAPHRRAATRRGDRRHQRRSAIPALEEVCDEFAPLVKWVHTPIPGKRNAVKHRHRGIAPVRSPCSSIPTPSGLPERSLELVKPFADRRVGGVTTRQRILEPSRTFVTRWADWLENTRSLYSMPAQSVLGQVGCLPGRTIAFRRAILVRVMDRLHDRAVHGRLPRDLATTARSRT